MKIVFFGTSDFSAGILECLSSLQHEILAVVTRPDRPQGRHLRLQASPVKEFALKQLPEIPIFQPEKASIDSFATILRELSPDLFLVVAYGEILRENILKIPTKTCMNIHTSLLPKYRGAAPIQACLRNGDPVSGVTFMEMVLKMDAGDILRQDPVEITSDMNAGKLEQELLCTAKKALPDVLENFDEYYRHKKPQNESLVTIASKIRSEDCLLDCTQSAERVYNQIRSLAPSPGAYINLDTTEGVKRLKILSAEMQENHEQNTPGSTWIGRDFIKIFCLSGVILPLSVQLEGKKTMNIEEFLRGQINKLFINK